jgi:DNA topoisomerase VI subunit B
MSTLTAPTSLFPVDPLERIALHADEAFKRRQIEGILESYNGNYDVLAEMIQNSVDAVEDAALLGLPEPFLIELSVNLKENAISVLDTGIGMTAEEIIKVCAPHATLKPHPDLVGKRGKRVAYRGYKGVGLTFLAYGTDDIVIHAKNKGLCVRI